MRTVTIPNETLLAIVGAPDGSKVERTGPTTGTERGKMDGVFVVISSEEMENKTMDSRIDLDRTDEPRSPQVPRDEPVPAEDDANPGDVPSPGKNPPPPPPPGS